MSDILILGYYGFKNSGDDALLLSMLQQLRKLDGSLKITVLSKNPKETSQIYNVKAVKRDNPFSLLKAILTCKMLIAGGGTLIQDKTSTKSLLYYLTVIRIARLFGKKVMLYANGIGPLSYENTEKTAKILNNVNLITLRDKMALECLKKIGVDKPDIRLCADSVFGLEYDKDCDISGLLKKNNISENQKYFCISVRDQSPEELEKTIMTASDYLSARYNMLPVFIPFQKEKDYDITLRIVKGMVKKAVILENDCTLPELMKFISGAELMIGMRLHSLIYSAVSNVPFVGLIYDPKVKGVVEYLDKGICVDADRVYSAELEDLGELCIKNSGKIKNDLTEACAVMKEKAEENAKAAIDLLRS